MRENNRTIQKGNPTRRAATNITTIIINAKTARNINFIETL
jgi:hypothetical protein